MQYHDTVLTAYRSTGNHPLSATYWEKAHCVSLSSTRDGAVVVCL